MGRRSSKRRRNPIPAPTKKRGAGVKFFSLQNAKARKGVKRNFIVPMLYMQPSDRVPGLPNVCPFAGSCREPCLNFSGNGGMYDGVQGARADLNRWYYSDKRGFVAAITKSIAALEKAALKWPEKPTVVVRGMRRKAGMRETFKGRYNMAYRLNGTSDLPWEKSGIMQRFPKARFYDYTKSSRRMLAFLRGQMPPNYHLTFSMGGTEDHMIPQVLEEGGNVTIVFANSLPKTYGGRFIARDARGREREVFVPETPVIDGDEDDLRFLDPRRDGGYLVGLRFKPPTSTEQARLLSEIGVDDFVYDPDAWPAHRLNPGRPTSGVGFRWGCGGYNVVVRGGR